MRLMITATILAATFASPVLASPDGPVGTWITEGNDSKVKIAQCGKTLCATILWAKQNGVDANNPDPALRERTIIGMPLTKDMKPDGKGGWAGSIYNPENGKTYKATMQTKSERELEVGGCVLGGLLCGSETWLRQGDSTASVSPASRR